MNALVEPPPCSTFLIQARETLQCSTCSIIFPGCNIIHTSCSIILLLMLQTVFSGFEFAGWMCTYSTASIVFLAFLNLILNYVIFAFVWTEWESTAAKVCIRHYNDYKFPTSFRKLRNSLTPFKRRITAPFMLPSDVTCHVIFHHHFVVKSNLLISCAELVMFYSSL